MWIVTQNGEKLVNMDKMSIIGATVSGKVQAVEHPFDDYAVDLGYYSSKEKALKVVTILATAYDDDHYGIFKMPEDEKIEI